MSELDRCDWCRDAYLVTLWHKHFAGDLTMTATAVNHRTGLVSERRVAGRITVHCRECTEGERRYQQFEPEQRQRLWTTRHMEVLCECYGYITTDPTYRELFSCEEDAIRWAAALGGAAPALPALPKAQRSTPERVADQLRRRAAKEDAA